MEKNKTKNVKRHHYCVVSLFSIFILFNMKPLMKHWNKMNKVELYESVKR